MGGFDWRDQKKSTCGSVLIRLQVLKQGTDIFAAECFIHSFQRQKKEKRILAADVFPKPSVARWSMHRNNTQLVWKVTNNTGGELSTAPEEGQTSVVSVPQGWLVFPLSRLPVGIPLSVKSGSCARSVWLYLLISVFTAGNGLDQVLCKTLIYASLWVDGGGSKE